MSWFEKAKAGIKRAQTNKFKVPEGMWVKCPGCSDAILSKDLDANMGVCPKCSHHHRISVRRRLEILMDEGVWQEHDSDIKSIDFLGFKDTKSYQERIDNAIAKSKSKDAAVCVEGTIEGTPVQVAVLDFSFMGGSMGSVVGEKITRAMERGLQKKQPVIIFSASGGARMQESILSLMQMAKTSAALGKLREARIPFISIMTDPTTGGVTASFAMLGDINIAEPKSLIGFAGPRVIEQTLRQTLPEGFQRAEYLLDHGMLDIIVPRPELRTKLSSIIKILCGQAS